MNKVFSYLRVNFLDRKHKKNYIINFKQTNLRSNQINIFIIILYYIPTIIIINIIIFIIFTTHILYYIAVSNDS